jgi:hypothetical protein
MRRACLLTLAGILSVDVAVAGAVVRHGSIPKFYLGSWAPSTESCGARSKAVIRLSAETYIRVGKKCIVRGVYETAGAHGSIYSARMQCSRSAGRTRNLIMEPGLAGRLLMGSDFNNLRSYQRCQSSNGATASQSGV